MKIAPLQDVIILNCVWWNMLHTSMISNILNIKLIIPISDEMRIITWLQSSLLIKIIWQFLLIFNLLFFSGIESIAKPELRNWGYYFSNSYSLNHNCNIIINFLLSTIQMKEDKVLLFFWVFLPCLLSFSSFWLNLMNHQHSWRYVEPDS